MKSPSTVVAPPVDDCDDIFGPPRTYPSGYYPPKNRPSMISAKYRQKEERRKVLKISINKLKKIEDPEASLCRSVLINNTMKRLQKEARDEKIQKQQLNYPRCYDHDNYLNIKSEFIKNENNGNKQCVVGFDESHDFMLSSSATTVDNEASKLLGDEAIIATTTTTTTFIVENDFDAKLAEEIDTVNAKTLDVFVNSTQVVATDDYPSSSALSTAVTAASSIVIGDNSNDRFSALKRSFDDMEDCDVQDVLSQFYMPPTPRMLTCIDDDEDAIVVDDVDVGCASSVSKRIKIIDDCGSVNSSGGLLGDVANSKIDDSFASVNFINNNNNNVVALTSSHSDSRLRYSNQSDMESSSSTAGSSSNSSNPYSCGHASMFNELQSNVYHNLIASLET